MSAPRSAIVARQLGKAQVVADLDPDPADRRVEYLDLVARENEAVDAEERKVALPVPPDEAVGPDEHRGVA